MKRGNYEGGPGPGAAPGGAAVKRHRGDKFEVRLLVPSKSAGSIIGKGGQNIQKLRAEFNASIRVPDCPGPERVMTVHADTPDVVANVLEQTVPVIADEASRSGQGQEDMDGHPQEVRLLIHQSIVGGIIGRAGFKIKEIRDASGANIKVYQTCAPQSTDRCVAVQGTIEKIILALKEVFDVINNTEIKGMDQPYDPINFDGYYALEYGGYGSEMDVYGGPGGGGGGGAGGGAGGGRAPSGGQSGGGGRGGMRGGGRGGGMNGGFGSGPPSASGGYNSFGGGRGGGGGGSRGGFGGRGGYDEGGYGGGRGGGGGNFSRGGGGQRGYGGGNAGDDGYNGGGGGGGGGGDSSYGKPALGGGGNAPNFGAGADQPPSFSGQDDGGEQETTQVTIPKDMAGAIIGPGGSRIRKIRSDSKASITIDEPVQGSNERIITITGSQRQIQTAQFLLQQSVREHAGPPQSGFGGPPQQGRF
jgi:heterogeneous nuclear ribonucleoprotein K